MRKSTFQSRIRMYIALLIVITILTSFTAITYRPDNTTINKTNIVSIDKIEAVKISKVNPLPDKVVVNLVPVVNPNDYDGDIVIATADEVITMTVVNGVKTFTNHLIG